MTTSARIALLRKLALEYQGSILSLEAGHRLMFIKELNGLHYDVLDEPPSPSEFMRLVHISRPVVIKGTSLS